MASSLFKLEWQEACFLVLEQAYKGWRQNATFNCFVCEGMAEVDILEVMVREKTMELA